MWLVVGRSFEGLTGTSGENQNGIPWRMSLSLVYASGGAHERKMSSAIQWNATSVELHVIPTTDSESNTFCRDVARTRKSATGQEIHWYLFWIIHAECNIMHPGQIKLGWTQALCCIQTRPSHGIVSDWPAHRAVQKRFWIDLKIIIPQ